MKATVLLFSILSSSLFTNSLHAQELSQFDQQLVKQRIGRIGEKDQQFRSYLSFQTTDEAEINEIKKLDAKGQLKAMADNEGGLSAEVQTLLNQLQRKNDQENFDEFISIVNKFGYPSPERLGVKTDRLFALLLHPPVDLKDIERHTQKLRELLLPEVKAGRMAPKSYATFVDNMRAKILRQPQLYGTNQAYDRASGKVLPPTIENLELANKARREIGLPELEEGQYRLAPGDNKPHLPPPCS